jgi:hypothetical protein
MAKESMEHLAETMTTERLPKTVDAELRKLRSRSLAPLASAFWSEVVRALASAAENFQKKLNDSPENQLNVSGDPTKAEITKRKWPYLRATLQLDVAGSCIRGTFYRATAAPSVAGPLFDTPFVVELRVDGNHVYGVLGSRARGSVRDIAEHILTLLLGPKKGA